MYKKGMIQGIKWSKCLDNSILNVGLGSQHSLCCEEIKKFEWRLRVELRQLMTDTVGTNFGNCQHKSGVL